MSTPVSKHAALCLQRGVRSHCAWQSNLQACGSQLPSAECQPGVSGQCLDARALFFAAAKSSTSRVEASLLLEDPSFLLASMLWPPSIEEETDAASSPRTFHVLMFCAAHDTATCNKAEENERRGKEQPGSVHFHPLPLSLTPALRWTIMTCEGA